MKILIVDDHPLLHEVLGAIARKTLGDAEILCARDLAEAFKHARAAVPPDLVLLDLGLPGCAGTEALSRFKRAFPAIRVLVVTASEERACILSSLALGAAGYIPKTHTPPLIAAALRLVADGGVYVPPEALKPGEDRASVKAPLDLTDRQLDVLRLIAKGHPNKEIARRLKIAEDTVKHHACNAYLLLGISSRIQVASAAVRYGLDLE